MNPLREVWSQAWPTVLTMTSYTVMQFVDSLMVGQVGPLELAAQGNAGIWTFIPLSLGMGLLTVVSTFTSQHLGAGTPERTARYAWATLWLSAICWIILLLPFALGARQLFSMIHPPGSVEDVGALVALETTYARILLAGGVFTLAARGMHHYFFGLHRPKIVTLSAILGNTMNIIINYILVFGEDGIPALGLPGVPGVRPLGLAGAAIGTVIGTAVELTIPLLVFLGPKMNRDYGTRRAWRCGMRPFRDLARVGWPAAVQYGNEVICWSIFMTILVGRFGEHHMTAGWIALRYMHLSFMPAVGFSVAVSNVVGRYIGAGEPNTAVARARLGVGMATSYMTVCAVLFLIFRHPLVAVFIGGEGTTPEEAAVIVEIGGRLMICAAIFQTMDALGIVYVGALRGAGDTVWPGLMTMVYSWVFIVGGGLLLVRFAPGLESLGPWIGAAAYIIVMGVTMALRFEGGSWRSIRLLRPDDDDDVKPGLPLLTGAPATTADGSVRDLAIEMVDEE